MPDNTFGTPLPEDDVRTEDNAYEQRKHLFDRLRKLQGQAASEGTIEGGSRETLEWLLRHIEQEKEGEADE